MSSSLFDINIMCMIMSSPSRSAVPLKIGGSLVYRHATGTITDLDKVGPYLPEETRVLAELHAEGVVKNLFRPSGQPSSPAGKRPDGSSITTPAPSLPGPTVR
jgi:hypothetical protein